MLTEEQRRARLGRVTSSNAAGALGLSDYMSPIQAMLSIKGQAPDISDSSAVVRGNLCEGPVLQFPCHELGLRYREAPWVEIGEWAGDSADGRYYDADGNHVAMAEAKTVGLGSAHLYLDPASSTDGSNIARSTWIQACWHLMAWPKVPECLIPVLIGGFDFSFRLYRVKRDDELIGLIRKDLYKWWSDHIVGDELPVVTGKDDSWFAKRYPRAVEGMMAEPVDGSLAAWCASYDAARDREKQARGEKDRAAAELKNILREHQGCVGSFGSVTWKHNRDTRAVDWKAIAERLREHVTPEEWQTIESQHTRTKPGNRPLLVKIKKG